MTSVDLEALRVTVPEGRSGAVEVRRFDVDDNGSFASFLTGRGRGVSPGTYTGLYRHGDLWMTDTPDECRDHAPLIANAHRCNARRVLLNGLGLGVAVNALIRLTPVNDIDVVEIDPDVVALVAPSCVSLAEAHHKRVEIHTGDAYTYRWPRGTRWDIAWHDVWPSLCADNLAGMARLHRRYGSRVVWQDSWGRDLCRRRRDQLNRPLYVWPMIRDAGWDPW